MTVHFVISEVLTFARLGQCTSDCVTQTRNSNERIGVQFNNFIIKKLDLKRSWKLQDFFVSRPRPFGQDQDTRLSAQDQDFFSVPRSRRLETKTVLEDGIQHALHHTKFQVKCTSLPWALCYRAYIHNKWCKFDLYPICRHYCIMLITEEKVAKRRAKRALNDIFLLLKTVEISCFKTRFGSVLLK